MEQEKHFAAASVPRSLAAAWNDGTAGAPTNYNYGTQYYHQLTSSLAARPCLMKALNCSMTGIRKGGYRSQEEAGVVV